MPLEAQAPSPTQPPLSLRDAGAGTRWISSKNRKNRRHPTLTALLLNSAVFSLCTTSYGLLTHFSRA